MCIEPLNKLTADSACRTFLSNDVSFASFINAAIFEGKQIIHPESWYVLNLIFLLLSMIQKSRR